MRQDASLVVTVTDDGSTVLTEVADEFWPIPRFE